MDDLQELTEIVERVAGSDSFAEAAETLTDWAVEFSGCESEGDDARETICLSYC